MKNLLFCLFLLPVVSWAQFIFVGSGDAMDPVFKNGEVVTVWPVKFEALESKDVAAFKYGDNIVASRLVRKNGGKWVTKGDGNDTEDQLILSEDSFMGRVTSEYMCVNSSIRAKLASTKGFYTLNEVFGYSYECNFNDSNLFARNEAALTDLHYVYSWNFGVGLHIPSRPTPTSPASSNEPTNPPPLPNFFVPDNSAFVPFFMAIIGLLYWAKRKCAV